MSQTGVATIDNTGNLIWWVESFSKEVEYWHRIIKVHNYAKSLILKGENISLDQEMFLQPMQEQRNVLEHIIRGMSRRLNDTQDPAKDEYVLDNLRKALGHAYRAYFDAADILSLEIISQIRDDLEPYDRVIIIDIIPEYYKDILPKMNNLQYDIANVRETKDISSGTTFSDIEAYNTILNDLLKIKQRVSSSIPDLEKAYQQELYTKNEKDLEAARKIVQEEKKLALDSTRNKYMVISIVITIIVAILSFFVGKNHSSSSNTPHSPTSVDKTISTH